MKTNYFTAKKRPQIATDIVIFSIQKEKLCVLLIERKFEPFKGMWALPGGFMEWGETCEQSAARELQEETGVKGVPLELLGVFSDPKRDPRGCVVSIAYIGAVRNAKIQGADDAAAARFVPVEQPLHLAADHDLILDRAKKFLLAKAYDYRWISALLPEKFTVKELDSVTRMILQSAK